MDQINWDFKLIAISGARGAGKTTLALQYLKHFPNDYSHKLYLSLDDIYFASNRLIDVVDHFVKYGGKILVLDEMHKYPNWSIEIKNIYDDYDDLKTVLTGSSLLQISKGEADLSRRVVKYLLPAMSFREFIEFDQKIKFPTYSLEKILSEHSTICNDIVEKIKPLPAFQKYLKMGNYPFYKEADIEYNNQLAATINLLLETDLPSVASIDYVHILKIKKLLLLIAENVPFKPNISEMSRKLEISRDSIMKYFDFLERAQLISMLSSSKKGFRRFEKPQKIYLNNCNLSFALTTEQPNIGTLRETFFFQHINLNNTTHYSEKGDFLVDNKYIFEIGGKNKSFNQIKDIPDSYIAADNIEYGYGNKIPLWLFGFLY